MITNLLIIEEFFNKCNWAYFEGKLPVPRFDLLHSYRTFGYFEYTKGGWFDKTLYNPTIYITDYYDFTEKQFIDIVCHEMIHYYLAYFGIDRGCHHGKEFKKMVDRLNRKYGLNITKRIDTSTFKRRKGTPWFTYWLTQKIF